MIANKTNKLDNLPDFFQQMMWLMCIKVYKELNFAFKLFLHPEQISKYRIDQIKKKFDSVVLNEIP